MLLTGRGALARVVGLAAVEGARIKLAPLTMRHPLLDRSALQQQILRHYTRAALNEGYKVLASVDILGEGHIVGQLCSLCIHPVGHVLLSHGIGRSKQGTAAQHGGHVCPVSTKTPKLFMIGLWCQSCQP